MFGVRVSEGQSDKGVAPCAFLSLYALWAMLRALARRLCYAYVRARLIVTKRSPVTRVLTSLGGCGEPCRYVEGQRAVMSLSSLTGSEPTVGILAAASYWSSFGFTTGIISGLRIPLRERTGGTGESFLAVNLWILLCTLLSS